MFLSPRNGPPEDVQQLINSGPSCKPSAAPSDMESGRGGGGDGASSRASTSSDQRVQRDQEEPGRSSNGFWACRYFSLSFLLLLGVTASLVILPLVLPPLPPPPSMLMLVPVAMLLVLLLMAFMPTSGGINGTGPTYL